MFGFAVLPTDEGDQLIVTGGTGDGSSHRRRNSKWCYSSLDGITWVARTEQAEFGPRKTHGLIVMDSRLIVVGGFVGGLANPSQNQISNPGIMADVWKSDDIGATWSEVTDSAEFGKRSRFGIVSDGHEMAILVGGQSDWSTREADVWVSIGSMDKVNEEEDEQLATEKAEPITRTCE